MVDIETASDRRVVITGLGLVTPLGIGVEETWTALCEGKSGISEITRFDASGFDSQIAGEVKDFHPEDFLTKKEAKRIQLFIAYAVAASRILRIGLQIAGLFTVIVPSLKAYLNMVLTTRSRRILGL